MSDMLFAYSLVQAESGWTWAIFDEEGETVARGLDRSQIGAQAAVESAIRQAASQMHV